MEFKRKKDQIAIFTLFIIISIIFFGFFIAFLKSQKIELNIFICLFLTFISYYITLIIHQGINYISAKSNNLEVMAFIIFPFLLIKKQGKFKLKIMKFNEFIFGGSMSVNISNCINKYQFDDFKKVVINYLRFSFLSGIFTLYLGCYFMYKSYVEVNSQEVLAYLYIVSIFTIFISIYTVLFSLFENTRNIFSYTNKNKFLEDEGYGYSQLLLNCSYTPDFGSEKYSFLLKNSGKNTAISVEEEKIDFEDIILLKLVIDMYLLKKINRVNVGFYKLVDYLEINFDKLMKDQFFKMLNLNLIYYDIVLLYLKDKKIDKGLDLFSKIKEATKNKKSKKILYFNNKIEYLINPKEDNVFVIEKKYENTIDKLRYILRENIEDEEKIQSNIELFLKKQLINQNK